MTELERPERTEPTPMREFVTSPPDVHGLRLGVLGITFGDPEEGTSNEAGAVVATTVTEAEWLDCQDPKALREASIATATDRKDRLFMAAFWHYHGRLLGAEQLLALSLFAGEWAERGEYPLPLEVNTILEDGEPVRGQVDWAVGKPFANYDAKTKAFHVQLLRCIFGNPFRPVSINPAWVTPIVTGLAGAAYEERAWPSGELAPARLVVLSDALEEAGCGDAGILAHLRSDGPHVRGCWPVDLILGNS